MTATLQPSEATQTVATTRAPTIKAHSERGVVRTIVECDSSQVSSLGLGTTAPVVAEYLLSQILNLTISGDFPDGPLDTRDANALLSLAASLEPETEYEAAIAVQIAMLHHIALDCGRRAMKRGATMEGRALNISHAGKLSRSCAMLLETLARSRGKGPSQVVRVEHVTINGGQAVVGAVAGVGRKSRGSTP
ncbi:hypothetical protein [Terricaulis sp.]|uniref:hypothetical protein n=1 Tax=Terricaulis sp. TaxID=2768686 RepID=UPI002AC64D52|nr:hypothetical protein [Terricaulis sp.]MDZ4692252.1 hypothetical protein [Terricaulis sp.]